MFYHPGKDSEGWVNGRKGEAVCYKGYAVKQSGEDTCPGLPQKEASLEHTNQGHGC